MNEDLSVYIPVAPTGKEPRHLRKALDGLNGKVIGFIDNAKPNFNHLVDDLAEVLVQKYGVAGIVKHRKSGQVPVGDEAIRDLAGKCDAIVAGSGD